MSFLTILSEEHKFTGKDDNEYTLTPLTLRDLGKFVSWVKFKPYRDAIEAGIPEERLKVIYEDCKRGKVKEEVEEGKFEEFDIHLQSSVVLDAMQDIEGIIKLLELSLSKNHPDVSFDEVCDEETLTLIQSEVIKASIGLDITKEPEKN